MITSAAHLPDSDTILERLDQLAWYDRKRNPVLMQPMVAALALICEFGSAQKIIRIPQDSEIARFFVLLPDPREIAFGVPN